MTDDDEFFKELKEGFLQEALDLLMRVEGLSLKLEKSANPTEIYEELARLAHNLKGSGKALGFIEISTLAHGVEDYLLAIKNQVIPNTPENMSFLFGCLDTLKRSVEVLAADPQAKVNHDELVSDLKRRSQPNQISEVVEIGAAPTVAAAPTATAVPAKTSTLEGASFRVSKAKLDYLLEAFGEQVILQSTLDQCKENWEEHRDLLLKTIAQMSKLTLELQSHALSLTMVNLRATFTKLERAVRDAAQHCHKDVTFSFSGEATEIDKTMMDALADPLIHMVRNAVDHGLEDSDQRAGIGKPRTGRVHVEARRVGGQFWLEVRDDGRGLDPALLKRKAVQKGLLSEEKAQRLTDGEAYRLIFASGFSTKETVSEVSGRGVGMNVVEESIQRLKGRVELESQLGQGMLIRIKLPLTLAIFNGAVVRIDQSRFIVPSSEIDEVSRIRSIDASSWVSTGPGQFMMRIRDELFEVIDLRRCLTRDAGQRTYEIKDVPVLLTRKHRNRAFLIDEIQGVQKIVQKPLSSEVKNRPGYVAGTILGDGSPGIVLNLEDLASSYTPLENRSASQQIRSSIAA